MPSCQPPASKSMLFRDSQLPEALLHHSRRLSATSCMVSPWPSFYILARVGSPSGFHLLRSSQNWSLELSRSGFRRAHLQSGEVLLFPGHVQRRVLANSPGAGRVGEVEHGGTVSPLSALCKLFWAHASDLHSTTDIWNTFHPAFHH